ncbi:peptidase M20 [Pacificimonas flava]|uniref:Peptidase M20 n=2 Tax=Pacificimonas TaxID=1960290 RepID=A0A219B6J6_9SPHN|nr:MULTISPECIES: M20/M25/M40 family metallo-hydrolase [Pacificimonas]MBZ6378759.1 M20/M25/M40 family metallo-hydrolase [Pacificimonas aurantium]OWV33977.1 peptidase M20 [Pacificimonas flava]
MFTARCAALLAFPIAAAAVPAAAQLSPAEQRIPAAVEAETETVEDFLEEIVNVNSGSLNVEGVRRVGQMVREAFEPLGFTAEWIDMAETGRAGHLVLTHEGSGEGKRMLLIGHLDTVFEPDSPFQRYELDPDDPNRAIGPGVADDKGGIAVLLSALSAMKAAGTLAPADIKIVLTGDEERPGSPLDVARRDLIEAGRWADVALGFEGLSVDADGLEYGTIARRSSTSWTLTTTGRQAHSSGVFSDASGYGAIYEMVRILDDWRSDVREGNLTFNVGVMGGGTTAEIDDRGLAISSSGKTNVIAQTAVARGGLRTLTPEQDADVRAKMQAIVALNLPGTDAELVFSDDGYPAMAPKEANRALLGELNEVSRDLGLPELGEWDPARRGAADISFVSEYVDAALAGMATDGGNSHAPGEYVLLDSITRQAKRMAVLMSRLALQPRD